MLTVIEQIEHKIENSKSFFIKFFLACYLLILYGIQTVVFLFCLLFFPAQTSFKVASSVNHKGVWNKSYYHHRRLRHNARFGTFSITMLLVVVVVFMHFVSTILIPTSYVEIAYATSLTVDDVGDSDDAIPGDSICDTGTGVCTLRAAITEANFDAGADTIDFNVMNGQFNIGSSLVITNPLTIDGSGGSDAFIQASGLGPGSSAFTVNSDNVTLAHLQIHNGPIGITVPFAHNNITLDNLYLSTQSLTGLKFVHGGDGIYINDCEISGGSGDAINIIDGENILISGGEFHNNTGDGIVIGSGSDVLITGSYLYNNDTDIRVTSSSDVELNDVDTSGADSQSVLIEIVENVSVISGDISNGSSEGLVFSHVTGDSFITNTELYNFLDNGITIDSSSGVEVSGVSTDSGNLTGMEIKNSSDITVSNNDFINNDDSGIKVNNSNSCVFSGNNITGNGDAGLYVYNGSQNNNFTDNDINENATGVSLSGAGSKNNNFDDNTINNNTLRAVIISGSVDNSFTNNTIIHSGSQSGIILDNSAQDNEFVGNTINGDITKIAFKLDGADTKYNRISQNIIHVPSIILLNGANESLVYPEFEKIVRSADDFYCQGTTGESSGVVEIFGSNEDNFLDEYINSANVSGSAFSLSQQVNLNAYDNLSFTFTDADNNTSSATTKSITVDTVAPNTNANLLDGSFYNSAQTLSLETSDVDSNGDPGDLAPVIYYAVTDITNGDEIIIPQAQEEYIYDSSDIELNDDGQYAIRFFAVDYVENRENLVAVNMTIDTMAPATVASLAEGEYSEIQQIELTATDNIDTNPDIYFTIDGTTPTMASEKYSQPININETTTLKYFAIDGANNQEAVNTKVYTFNTETPEPDIEDKTGPVIDDFIISDITADSAVISFSTDEGAINRITYGINSADLNLATSWTSLYSKSHLVTLDELVNGQKYYLQIYLKDINGNQTITSIKDFTTVSLESLNNFSINSESVTPTVKSVTISDKTPQFKFSGFADSFANQKVEINIKQAEQTILTLKAKIKKTGRAKVTVPDADALDVGNYKIYTGITNLITPTFKVNLKITDPKPNLDYIPQITTATTLNVLSSAEQVNLSINYLNDDEIAHTISTDNQNGVFSISLPFWPAKGEYVLKAQAKSNNIESEISQKNIILVPEEYASVLTTINSDANYYKRLTYDNPILVGLVAKEQTVYINDEPVVMQEPCENVCSWHYAYSADLGINTAKIEYKNSAGKVITASNYLFKKDLRAIKPQVVSHANNSDYTKAPLLTIIGHKNDILTISKAGKIIKQAQLNKETADSNIGAYEFNTAPYLDYGKNTFTFIAKENSKSSEVSVFNINMRRPVASVTTPKTSEPVSNDNNEEEIDKSENNNTANSNTNTNTPTQSVEDANSNMNTNTNNNEKLNDAINKIQENYNAGYNSPSTDLPYFTVQAKKLSAEQSEKLKNNLSKEIKDYGRIIIDANNQIVTPQVADDGSMIFNVQKEFHAPDFVRQLLGLQNRAVQADELVIMGQLKQADYTDMPAYALVSVYSNPVVKLAQVDTAGKWSITIPLELLPAGQHSAYVQTEVNGVKSDQVELVKFVIEEQTKLSRTTWLVIINLVIAIVIVLVVIIIQLVNKNKSKIDAVTNY
ncbi:MAG: right-handed parallel beta-helix repeat-containing protein [Patescibacteria group bacterium]